MSEAVRLSSAHHRTRDAIDNTPEAVGERLGEDGRRAVRQVAGQSAPPSGKEARAAVVDSDGAVPRVDVHMRLNTDILHAVEAMARTQGCTKSDYVSEACANQIMRDTGHMDSPTATDAKLNQLIDAVDKLSSTYDSGMRAMLRQVNQLIEMARGDNYLADRTREALDGQDEGGVPHA